MNPKSIACMWAFTMLTALSIASGAFIAQCVVAALVVAFTIYAIV